jgi:hypothetical protein
LLIGTSGGTFNAIHFCRLVGEGFGFLGVRVGLVGRLLALHAFCEMGGLPMVQHLEPVNYEWIKRTAKQQRVSVNDLIVLAPQNDPFYAGTPGDIAAGQWFAQMWQQLQQAGEARAHLRRVHYFLVSLGGRVKFPNGKPYENTVECWDMLNMASKAARYLGLVDPGAFNDKRTPPVVTYAEPVRSYRPHVEVYNPDDHLSLQLPDFPRVPQFYIDEYKSQQRYHLEVWCEKSTMNDVLEPLCQRYKADLQIGAGEMSITAALALVNRLVRSGKPARVLYVSDFDPAGQSMPVAVSRKIEYFVRKLGLDLDIRLFPVVLTLEQVQYYQLPRTPIKETERRRAGFEERHGEGAVELDALEALYPGALERVLSQCLDHYYDWTLEDRVSEERQALRDHLGEIWQDVTRVYQPEIEVLQTEYERLCQEFEGRAKGLSDRLQIQWQAIQQELGYYTKRVIADHPAPQPFIDEELGDGLYNSQRDYLEQVQVYKEFQGRL